MWANIKTSVRKDRRFSFAKGLGMMGLYDTPAFTCSLTFAEVDFFTLDSFHYLNLNLSLSAVGFESALHILTFISAGSVCNGFLAFCRYIGSVEQKNAHIIGEPFFNSLSACTFLAVPVLIVCQAFDIFTGNPTFITVGRKIKANVVGLIYFPPCHTQ